ncbi:hypothetical protein [Pseudogracilibacillus sp. SO30301A]|uniref:hypothetical protein n=1 Tax=Pseudogracilibacillus sp. SO30301A TaxID=3098291 RepID=UPI00300E2FEE
MRKKSLIMSESGFYLPLSMVVSMIVLSAVITSVLIYKNETKVSYMLKEQIEVETLIQMARAKFKEEEVYKNRNSGQITYEFPSGTTIIQYEKIDTHQFTLQFDVTTNEHSYFTIHNKLNLQSE